MFVPQGTYRKRVSYLIIVNVLSVIDAVPDTRGHQSQTKLNTVKNNPTWTMGSAEVVGQSAGGVDLRVRAGGGGGRSEGSRSVRWRAAVVWLLVVSGL